MRLIIFVLAMLLGATGVTHGQAQPGWPAYAPEVTLGGVTAHPNVHGACASDIDLDGLVEVLGTSAAAPWMWSFEPDGTISPGWNYQIWPFPPPLGSLPLGGIQSHLHFGDITGDGLPEIVFTNYQERWGIYALDSMGVMLPGWPLLVGEGNDDIGRIVLADLTGDGVLEVLVHDRWSDWQGRIWVYDGAGNVLPGWPQVVEGYAVGLAVGDLEFDGALEIVSSSADPWQPDEGPYPIYVFDVQGSLREGWPVLLTPSPLTPGTLFEVAIADLDGDYKCEIYGPGEDVFYILDWQGNLASAPIYGGSIMPAAAADLEGDGLLELVIPSFTVSIYRLWDHSFLHLPPSYLSQYNHFDCPVIADVDGDGICEIGARSGSPPALHLFDANLQPLPGWPKPTLSIDTSLRRPVSIADLDADGDLEMVCAAQSYIECWSIPNPSGNALRVEWKSYNHDDQRTGNYHFGRPPPGPRYLRGDANGDGGIWFGDAFAFLEYLFGGEEHPCPARLDWDASGAVDLCDVVNQLQYNFGGGPPPSAPYPACAMTEDGPLPCAREACP